MKGFIGVDEKLLAECRNRYQCIWVETALVKPVNSNIFYCVDCFFHKYSATSAPEHRLLLSYSSRTSLHAVKPGVSGGLRVVEADGEVCSRSGIEAYFSSLSSTLTQEMKQLSEEREKNPGKLSFRSMLLGLILPRQRDALQEEGWYWGRLTRYRIGHELMGMLGFENGVLNAEVDTAFILYRFDAKGRVAALIGGRAIDLPSYSKILDKGRLMADLALG
ncbi:hypothetical protein [Desulfurococcus mucosus]|uniref:Uncharacterized protein n=1 Tax=Desulfurococcus mucosus (strain ATCC 35584 / DSM 2162 / JCM 9187 / O7/1) TaxID=765177 RepID=E8R827_DESM0|nr:hypothetical protein [Desulfurococcus mucosus]ADV64653.1 hypothetical protein Desmu_0334 [Desulfurococcus mucosus DSM 2162]